ncbi:aspartate kinase [Coprinopsis cinerea AmutBmut pab1-1]|nr:aspartate kinase [Coprinopsis cinerea AmutBmut pab1-1]
MSPGLSPLSDSLSAPPTPKSFRQNPTDLSTKWLVQKFGGTSVGKFPIKIATDVVAKHLDGHKVAIVCSARSGSTKALGTTSLLLKAASQALQRSPKCGTSHANGAHTPIHPRPGHNKRTYSYTSDGDRVSQSPPSPRSVDGRSSGSSSPRRNGILGFTPLNGDSAKSALPEFHATVDLIKDEHFKAARSSIRDPEILAELEEEIDSDCEWLRSFLCAAQVIDEISSRSKDSVIGLGEKLACKLMAAVLRDQGMEAEYVSLEDIVPSSHLTDDSDLSVGAIGLEQPFYDELAKAIAQRIDQCGSRIPVVTGFFGPVPGSLLAQIGRGYTDLCAALLAVGLNASELQIWKEVDGIFTADPRKVPSARLIPVISPDEAAELTYYGSEVVHPFVMEQAIRKKIPIRIKNVQNPSGGGTVIHPATEDSVQDSQWTNGHTTSPSSERPPTHLPLGTNGYGFDDPRNRRLPTAVTIKENILVINVHSNKKSVSHGFLAGIFGTLDRYGVVVDLISTSEVHVSMAIVDGMGKRMVDRFVVELKRFGEVSVEHDLAILSLVGKHMRSMVGVAAKMFSSLAERNVNIEMISQGASEINISCVIAARDAVKALNIIHQGCLKITPEEPMGRVGPWLF